MTHSDAEPLPHPGESLADELLDASPVGLLLLDAELRCVRINRAGARLCGRSVEDSAARTLDELVRENASKIVPLVRLVLQTGVAFADVDVDAVDGATLRRWTSSCKVVAPVGEARLVALTIVETMSPNEALSKARDDETMFRAVFERAPFGMMVLEWHGQAVRINQAWRDLLGYSDEELTQLGVAGITHPDDFAPDVALFTRLMAGEFDRYRIVKRYIRKGGALMWGHLLVSLVRDAEGQPALIISMVEDITERKRAEGERDRLIEKLEEGVRTREVFLSIASHELRTPLTPLQLKLQILRDKLAKVGEPPPELDQALRQTERLSKLVDALFDVSRIETGRFILEMERFDLGAITSEVAESFRPMTERAGCTLSVEVVTAATPVRADRLRIEQLISNLLSNALKFGARKPIEVRVEAAPAHARLLVRDRGIGIPPEQHARIFERYERAVSEQHYGGLGLGLHIAREIVEAHGGRIRVESEPGAGATLLVELPLES